MTGAQWRVPALVLIVALTVAIGIANLPVQTKQGVDFVTSSSTLPLYVKALDFVQRDASYRRLAHRIAGDGTSPEARAVALFDWTRKNIRDTPKGFPIVDDHVWHTIVRGYGEDDQKADVFTTLATYAGVPSFYALTQDSSGELPLSFAWIDGKWVVCDVANGVMFRNSRGALASASEVADNPGIVVEVSAGRVYRDRPYASYFMGFRPPAAPDVLRPELQMVWPRVSHRLKRLVGLGRREWQED